MAAEEAETHVQQLAQGHTARGTGAQMNLPPRAWSVIPLVFCREKHIRIKASPQLLPLVDYSTIK